MSERIKEERGKGQCVACWFWEPKKSPSFLTKSGYSGECRKYPKGMDGWPCTDKDDWCGEFSYLFFYEEIQE